MTRFRFLLVATASLALTGCVTTGHFNKTNATQVDLSTANFRVVKSNVTGSHTAVRILGLGDSPSYAEAMKELRAHAAIEGTSRALVNVTEERHRLMLPPFYVSQTLVLTADVVEFQTEPMKAPIASASLADTPMAPAPAPSSSSAVAIAPSSEPATASEMLRRYALAHNHGRNSGSFEELVDLFQPNARIVFHGEFEGELRGHDEILQAFETHPPKDDLVLLQTRKTRQGVVASYANASKPGISAGKLAVRVVDGRIARLDMKIDGSPVN